MIAARVNSALIGMSWWGLCHFRLQIQRRCRFCYGIQFQEKKKLKIESLKSHPDLFGDHCVKATLEMWVKLIGTTFDKNSPTIYSINLFQTSIKSTPFAKSNSRYFQTQKST